MITYVYQCVDCKWLFEEKQRITDDALTTCPECGNNSLKKVLQSQRSMFLNEGWIDMEAKGHMHPTKLEKKIQNKGEF